MKKPLVQWSDPAHRPATIPKKIQTASASRLTFWNEEVANPFGPDTLQDDESDMDAFFTSTEHLADTATPSRTRFSVREVRRGPDHVVLVGDGIECHVSGEWSEAEFRPNKKVSVVGCLCCEHMHGEHSECRENAANVGDAGRLFVDDTQNCILVEDDLMTVTAFCSALRCINRPYVSARVADIRFGHSNASLVIGVIAHSIIEKALVSRNFSLDFLVRQAKRTIAESVVLMYTCGVNEATALNETLKLIKNIYSFQDHRLSISETEKKLVSLLLGLKGSADAIGEDTVLEIKSGRSAQPEHRAQALLYALMLRERSGRTVQPYVYYIPTKSLVEIPLRHQEIRSLLALRNRLALGKSIQECTCDDTECCRILARIQRLGPDHFLRRQLEAIDREEEMRSRDALVGAVLKFQKGTLVGMALERDSLPPNEMYIDLFSEDQIRLCRGIIEESDGGRVIARLSEEPPLKMHQKLYVSVGLSDVFFRFMRFSLVHVAYPRYLAPGSGFTLPGEAAGLECTENKELSDTVPDCFTSDEDVVYSPRTLSDNREDADRPGLCLPEKDQMPIPEEYRDEFLRLNDDQRSALFLALNCRHYRVIHGMPGTGKSMLICLLIKILVHLRKKVLLVCYTNLALANITKRLGTVCVYRARKEELQFKTTADAEAFFGSVELVAGTCFSFADPVFINRTFDFCVIDEGSQQHLLLSLVPVSISQRFAIVGDHLQLKPLSRGSRDLGLSLFEHLLGSDHSMLRRQYRMGTEIMRLSNSLFYSNQLCGNARPSTVQFVDTAAVDIGAFVSSLADCTILCYFNAQVELIRSRTRCVVETVDRFQGSEDNKVVVVFDPVSRCEVMESSERLNVALTRARRHLVLAGNRERMMEIGVLRSLLGIL